MRADLQNRDACRVPQARMQDGGRGCTGWEKGSAQKCLKEERKFHPDMSAKTNVNVPLRYDKIKMKKVRKKEDISKRKEIKLKT